MFLFEAYSILRLHQIVFRTTDFANGNMNIYLKSDFQMNIFLIIYYLVSLNFY